MSLLDMRLVPKDATKCPLKINYVNCFFCHGLLGSTEIIQLMLMF